MYSHFDPNAIHPSGWLRRQLEIQARGLSGNLDKMWPDIRDSAWLGGDRDGWERMPYWLDGFIPLAWLLDDPELISRADRYVGTILDRQQEDGWFCPCPESERQNYDLWAFFLICKVLALYCEFTQSSRAEQGLYRGLRCIWELTEKKEAVLKDWGKFRWFEALIPIQFLYDRCGESWLVSLGKELMAQGADYEAFAEEWVTPLNQWTYQTHIVNLCMMLKYEALTSRLFGESDQRKADRLWSILERYNGTAVGTFTGDECLSGLSNVQGTELCSVVELMYSCEVLYAHTGDARWADRLEKAAFNALPAAMSDDMWTHQYDQMVNQIACQEFPGKSFFRTNGSESHLFGLEPNYGCCTANFSQGWPKLAMNVFLKTDTGILCAMMLPAVLDTVINGVRVRVESESSYPFRNSCSCTVTAESPVTFELKIRIPGWAKGVRINGETVSPKGCCAFSKEWNGTETLMVELDDSPRLVRRPFGLKAVEYGALVYALPIEAEYRKREYVRDGVERKYPYCDWELIPRSPWDFGFAGTGFEILEKDVGSVPFSSANPPAAIRTGLCRIHWGFADGYDTVAAKKPASVAALSEPEPHELIPYGCAKLRMTEMPIVRTKK